MIYKSYSVKSAVPQSARPKSSDCVTRSGSSNHRRAIPSFLYHTARMAQYLNIGKMPCSMGQPRPVATVALAKPNEAGPTKPKEAPVWKSRFRKPAGESQGHCRNSQETNDVSLGSPCATDQAQFFREGHSRNGPVTL